MKRPPQALQILGSVLIALAIAAVAIALVTAHFGATSTAKLEAREDIIKERQELRDQRAEEREEAREEREKRLGR
ncbi:MAG TPA: hypothetical protein VFI03_08605 [Solirubrobacterales bacterium]|nr:hypothetical protein [Solirubrobacterales bacterium]